MLQAILHTALMTPQKYKIIAYYTTEWFTILSVMQGTGFKVQGTVLTPIWQP
jgi:hypothetical protein